MAIIKGARELKLKLGKIGPAAVREAHRALERGAQKIADRAAAGIYESGSRNNPGPSKPNEFPAGKSGRLAQSMTVTDHSTSDTLRWQASANVSYAPHLELGTSKMAPRPFMGPSFDESVGAIKADVRAAVKRGIRKGAR